MFKSSFQGLSENEAAARLRCEGNNEITFIAKTSIIGRFFSYFKNPLIVILLFAAVISAFMQDTASALIIAILVLCSVTLNFFEEYSADRAAKKLQEKVKINTCVFVLENKKRLTLL